MKDVSAWALILLAVASACGGGEAASAIDAGDGDGPHDGGRDARAIDAPHICPGGTDSPTSCGPACEVCPGAAHGEATCSANTCGLTCDGGYHDCANGCCRDLSALAVGGVSSCAITLDGALACWGLLGDASTPVAVPGFGAGVAQVAMDDETMCVLGTSGGLQCAGTNDFGELGDGSNADTTAPVAVTGLGSGVTAIGMGDEFACALTTAGAVLCWGRNSVGALGDGTETSRSTPGLVSGLGSGVTAIAVGETSACALLATGHVSCWGDFLVTHSNTQVPVPVTNLTDAVAITAANASYCAITSTGSPVCWGLNNRGQLGNGSDADVTPMTASAVTGLATVTHVAGGSRFACAITTAGAVSCWGDGSEGALGNGTFGSGQFDESGVPVAVSGIGSGATQIASSSTADHACAIVHGGVLCWGLDNQGQLGNGTQTTGTDTPVTVTGL